MITKQITVSLENRPGALAKATRAMAKAGVNIEAISVAETTDIGLVRMIVSDTDAAIRATDAMGLQCLVEQVAVLPLENEPGKLAEVAARAAREGININYVYGSSSEASAGTRIRVVISASDLDELERLWE